MRELDLLVAVHDASIGCDIGVAVEFLHGIAEVQVLVILGYLELFDVVEDQSVILYLIQYHVYVF